MHVRYWVRAAMPAVALALAGAPLLAQGESDAEWLERCQEDGWSGRRERHCEVREMRLPAPRGTISVDGRENGGVHVAGGERDSLVVRARIRAEAPTEEEAREIAGRVRVDTSGATIRADGPDRGAGRVWWVSFAISVPRRADLRVETHNGPIAVRGVTGRMELRAVNGPVMLRDVGGDVRSRTENGPLTIDLSGDRWEGAGLDAETRNGPVRLTLPDRYSARLETGTENGPMHVDFPMTVQGRIGRRITTDLGSGGPTVRAITTNGPVVIARQ